MKKHIIFIVVLFSVLLTYAQDWKGVPVPANAGNNKVWNIQNQHSDDFNYNGKNATFNSKWIDNHRAGWSGPGETQFSANHSDVTGGNLRIKAGRVNNKPGKTVYCGHVTTKTPIKYPVFTEVRMKCSGINLSSNFWLLGADDVNEIDITETYGAERNNGKKMATNYHIFQRSPFRDLANSPRKYNAQGNVFLRDDFHRFGLYWKSATEFEFYLDGKLVRKLNRSNDLRDPRNRFFDKAMHIIMNTELHTWKSNAGIRPSNQELNNNSINKMYIDWVRTYKPVNGTPPPSSETDKVSFKNAPTTINPANSYTFDMEYSASVDREITVSFWKNNTWVASKVERVTKGSGTKAVTINLPSIPAIGQGYAYKSHIRPVNTNWQQALDNDEVTNVTIAEEVTPPPVSNQLIANGTYYIDSPFNTQRLLSRAQEQHSARMHDVANFDDQKWVFKHLGDDIYTIQNKGNNRYLEVSNAKCGNGSNVTTWIAANDTHQKWKIGKNGNIYILKPMHCQSVALDRDAGIINANVHTWLYSANNNNQKWNIVSTSASRSAFVDSSEIDIQMNRVKLYPNPAQDFIHIAGLKSNTRVSVINSYGTKVITTRLNHNFLDIDKLPSGIYFLQTDTGVKIQFIKK